MHLFMLVRFPLWNVSFSCMALRVFATDPAEHCSCLYWRSNSSITYRHLACSIHADDGSLSPEGDRVPLLWVWRARWKSTALLHDVTFFFKRSALTCQCSHSLLLLLQLVKLTISAECSSLRCFAYTHWNTRVVCYSLSGKHISHFFHSHKIHLSIGRNCHVWWFLFRCNLLWLLLLELMCFWRNVVFKHFTTMLHYVMLYFQRSAQVCQYDSIHRDVTFFDQTDFDSAECCL